VHVLRTMTQGVPIIFSPEAYMSEGVWGDGWSFQSVPGPSSPLCEGGLKVNTAVPQWPLSKTTPG
jgi:hypothetical protein